MAKFQLPDFGASISFCVCKSCSADEATELRSRRLLLTDAWFINDCSVLGKGCASHAGACCFRPVLPVIHSLSRAAYNVSVAISYLLRASRHSPLLPLATYKSLRASETPEPGQLSISSSIEHRAAQAGNTPKSIKTLFFG